MSCACRALVIATVGVGTVLIPSFGVAITKGGGYYCGNVARLLLCLLETLKRHGFCNHFVCSFSTRLVTPFMTFMFVHCAHKHTRTLCGDGNDLLR